MIERSAFIKLSFQSTLPRRERLIVEFDMAEYRNFNPRSREGSDNRTEWDVPAVDYFNPRSREGSDGSSRAGRFLRPNFNPRSREGSDLFGKMY